MSKKILIVEDTRTIPEVIKVYLLGNDYEYFQAQNGVDGLKVAQQEKPDLIISDIKMPMMDGFQFCEALESRRRAGANTCGSFDFIERRSQQTGRPESRRQRLPEQTNQLRRAIEDGQVVFALRRNGAYQLGIDL